MCSSLNISLILALKCLPRARRPHALGIQLRQFTCMQLGFVDICCFRQQNLRSISFPTYPLAKGSISALVIYVSSLIFISHLHVQTISPSSLQGILPSGTCMTLSRCLQFSHDQIFSFLLSTAKCKFQSVQFPLLLSNCPTFCSIHHDRFHRNILHFRLSTLLVCSCRTSRQQFVYTLTRQFVYIT